jgi:hypothetical protein
MPPTYFEGGEPVYMGVCPPSCHYEQGANHLLAHLGMCVKREQSATTVIPHHGFRHPDEIHREYIFICHPYDGFCTSDMTLCFSQSPPPPLSPPPSPVSPAPLAPPGAVSFPPSMPGAVDLIIDTDMSVDVDDAGMLCAAHALADLGEANILAVMHNSHLKAGAGAISAINSYYGRSSLPIGVYRGDVGKNSWFDQPDWTRHGRGVYVEDLVQTFSPPQPNWVGLPDAVDAYRSTLATARDGSVSIVQVGYATNMLNLLESPPDHHSALNGRDLVARKAGRVFIMGGHDPGGSQLKQWSFAGGCKEAGCSYESLPSITKRQLELLPQSVPKIFFSFESGEKQQTGRNIAERNLPNSPCDRRIGRTMPSRRSWLVGPTDASLCSAWRQALILQSCARVHDCGREWFQSLGRWEQHDSWQRVDAALPFQVSVRDGTGTGKALLQVAITCPAAAEPAIGSAASVNTGSATAGRAATANDSTLIVTSGAETLCT